MSGTITTFSLFEIKKGSYLAALRSFGFLRMQLKKAPGLLFGKAMGCGRGAVFSILPDWGRYAFLLEWEDADAARNFVALCGSWQALTDSAASHKHLKLLPVHKHGLWGNAAPFSMEGNAIAAAGPMAVLTRANMNLRHLRSFWKQSYLTTDAVKSAPGLQFSLGMGELPFVRQATFSIWDNAESMKNFAYRNPEHIRAMQEKRKKNWFAEEMYVRFTVVAEGSTLPAVL